jgi:hypothetical protein
VPSPYPPCGQRELKCRSCSFGILASVGTLGYGLARIGDGGIDRILLPGPRSPSCTRPSGTSRLNELSVGLIRSRVPPPVDPAVDSRSSTDAEADDSSPSDPADSDEDGSPRIDSTVAEEVTRVEAVRYLEGASGHGVLSLLFLVVAVVLSQVEVWGGSAMALVVAYGVALNGLSIYAWDELRRYFAGVVEDRDDGEAAERELTPHRFPTEMKAELLTGFTMVGGFAAALAVGLRILRAIGLELAIYLSVAALALANVGALAWKYLAGADR